MKKGKRGKRQKRNNFQYIIFATLLVLLGFSILCIFPKKKKEEPKKEEEKVTEASTTIAEKQVIEEDWRLLLINKDNKVPDDYDPPLEKIDKNIYFDQRATKELKQMVNKMREEGIKGIWIQSSYRTQEKQERLFQNKVEQYKKMGYNEEQAESLAQMLVQKPGCSEHNIALSVDFNNVKEEFEDTKAFKWLTEHAADYGFILRYPKDKVEKTGVNYEPWHWRYVGKEHASKIQEKGYCLEEYLEEMAEM